MPLFLAGPLAKFVAIALVIAALFGLGYYRGYAAEKQAWDAAISKQAIDSAKTVIAGSAITAKVITKYIRVKGDTETIIKEIEKEVPVYVQSTCPVPTGFVNVWNAANALRPSTTTTSGTNAAPSGLTLADVANQHVTEAGLYHAETDKLAALQAWVKAQYDLLKATP